MKPVKKIPPKKKTGTPHAPLQTRIGKRILTTTATLDAIREAEKSHAPAADRMRAILEAAGFLTEHEFPNATPKDTKAMQAHFNSIVNPSMNRAGLANAYSQFKHAQKKGK